MTELPSAGLSQCIGLQARSFKARAGPDMSDRSAWTDTPADREKKAKVCLLSYASCTSYKWVIINYYKHLTVGTLSFTNSF